LALYDGTTEIGTATVSRNGLWSDSITLTGNGIHTLTAQDTDAAGNTGTSNSVVYTINTIANASYTFTTIDAPPAYGSSAATELLGINDAGQILGGSSYSFLYTNGTFTTINVPSGGGATGGPNNAGQIVGLFSNSTGTHGFLDTNGTFTTIDDPDATIYTPATTATEAYGINNSGQIVGISLGPGYWESFLDNNGTFTTITDPLAYFNGGPPGGGTISGGGTFATGINDSGHIVGYYFDSKGGTTAS
jgi:hypothetical protein